MSKYLKLQKHAFYSNLYSVKSHHASQQDKSQTDLPHESLLRTCTSYILCAHNSLSKTFQLCSKQPVQIIIIQLNAHHSMKSVKSLQTLMFIY